MRIRAELLTIAVLVIAVLGGGAIWAAAAPADLSEANHRSAAGPDSASNTVDPSDASDSDAEPDGGAAHRSGTDAGTERGDSPDAPAAGPSPAATGGPSPAPAEPRDESPEDHIVWQKSQAMGTPQDGHLVAGVQLPVEGRHFFTWDPEANSTPSPAWRRVGTDTLVRTLLRVIEGYAEAHPDAPRVTVGDLSRPVGGPFTGHASHQNGLDVDIYYPRLDRRETEPTSVSQIDMELAQDLVDRFVEAGAEFVFVGPGTGLQGPPEIVQPLRNHDNHIHVRLPAQEPPTGPAGEPA